MCDFISWIEKDDKVYFLNGKQLFHTLKGKSCLAFSGSSDDICGHGMIRKYYNDLQGGIEKECTDFTSPANFPGEIVGAIKSNKMAGFPFPQGLLLDPLDKDYRAKRDPLDKDYWALFAKVGNRIATWR